MTSTQQSNNRYDIIIIGGGIAGLYSAYNIQKMSPHCKILVLESYNKKWLGGRISNEMFQGVQVVTGAGVGRKEKDCLLIDLLKELKIPYSDCHVSHNYAQTIQTPSATAYGVPSLTGAFGYGSLQHPMCNVKKTLLLLKSEYKKSTIHHQKKTFKEFATGILGVDAYKQFTICSGYTDYENEDVYDTLYNYGFEDNYGDWTSLRIQWKTLIDTITKKIGLHNIKTSNTVSKIDTISPYNFVIHTEQGPTYSCNKVIIATTIKSVLKIVPGASDKNSIYQQIHGQTFLRVYGKFSKASASIMKQLVTEQTIVPGPLKKIIPMDTEKGVYMIAYTDNEDAISLKKYLENTPENRNIFCELLELSLGIPDGTLHLNAITDYYWPIGTHYYEPLRGPYKNRSEFIKTAQHPMPGMLVVGEMISKNQGWTQGALESVDAVVTKKWV
jgi:hypothetical protein